MTEFVMVLLIALAYLSTGFLMSLVSVYFQGKYNYNFGDDLGLPVPVEILFWPFVYFIILPFIWLWLRAYEFLRQPDKNPWKKARARGAAKRD